MIRVYICVSNILQYHNLCEYIEHALNVKLLIGQPPNILTFIYLHENNRDNTIILTASVSDREIDTILRANQ